MNYLKERVAYLKGLAEGMQISDSTNEGKLLRAIIDVLDDVALSVDDIEEVQKQMSDQIDDIDEDLAELENYVFGEEEDERCGHSEDDEEDEGQFECPHCGEIVNIEEAEFNEANTALECPHCHKEIEIEWDCNCEECDGENED